VRARAREYQVRGLDAGGGEDDGRQPRAQGRGSSSYVPFFSFSFFRYEGSTLVAVKMTGDNNVPKGEITFTADLSPEGLLGPVGRDSLSHPAEKIRLVLGTHSQKSQKSQKAAHDYFFFFSCILKSQRIVTLQRK